MKSIIFLITLILSSYAMVNASTNHAKALATLQEEINNSASDDKKSKKLGEFLSKRNSRAYKLAALRQNPDVLLDGTKAYSQGPRAYPLFKIVLLQGADQNIITEIAKRTLKRKAPIAILESLDKIKIDIDSKDKSTKKRYNESDLRERIKYTKEYVQAHQTKSKKLSLGQISIGLKGDKKQILTFLRENPNIKPFEKTIPKQRDQFQSVLLTMIKRPQGFISKWLIENKCKSESDYKAIIDILCRAEKSLSGLMETSRKTREKIITDCEETLREVAKKNNITLNPIKRKQAHLAEKNHNEKRAKRPQNPESIDPAFTQSFAETESLNDQECWDPGRGPLGDTMLTLSDKEIEVYNLITGAGFEVSSKEVKEYCRKK